MLCSRGTDRRQWMLARTKSNCPVSFEEGAHKYGAKRIGPSHGQVGTRNLHDIYYSFKYDFFMDGGCGVLLYDLRSGKAVASTDGQYGLAVGILV